MGWAGLYWAILGCTCLFQTGLGCSGILLVGLITGQGGSGYPGNPGDPGGPGDLVGQDDKPR